MPENTFTTYSANPYHDDFHKEDANGLTPEQKNYLRVLYKPGVSVQTRELNQMQSMLQAQIDKLGRGVFQEGASIVDGEKNFDNNIDAIDVTFTGNINDLLDVVIENDEGLKATVLHHEDIVSIVEGEDGEEDTEVNIGYRLFIRYNNTVQDDDEENVKRFESNKSLSVDKDGVDGILHTKTNGIRKAAIVKVESGVFFVRGSFVIGKEQKLYMVKPHLDDGSEYLINGKVAFEVEEGKKGTIDDTTLYDNANGTPNFAAPGADRYYIDLKLKFISDTADTADTTDGFVNINNDVIYIDSTQPAVDHYSTLMTIINGSVQTTVQESTPNKMAATIASRTSEESGDYTVEPFIIDVREYWNDITDEENRGLYDTDQIKTFGITVPRHDISGIAPNGPVELNSQTTDSVVEQYGESRFSVGLEPSVAYVDGYRVEAKSKINIEVEKARQEHKDVLVHSTSRLGNYIKGTKITGIPKFGEVVKVGGTNIGKVRGLEKWSDSDYRLYLYDLENVISEVGENTSKIIGNTTFELEYSDNRLYDGENAQSVFEFPYDNISDVSQTEFTVRERDNKPINNNTILLKDNIGTGSVFFSKSVDSYIVCAADGDNNGKVITVTNVDFGVNNSSVTLTLASNLGASNANVLYSYKTTNLTHKTKTKESGTKTLSLQNGGTEYLNHTDIIKITSAFNDDGDTIPVSDIVLDNGQRDGLYKKGSVRYTGNLSDDKLEVVTINYEYFSHSDEGSFFSRNSYTDIDYADIPDYKETQLSNALDFRPSEGAVIETILEPNSVIESRVNYYLNRTDIVVVNNVGEFNVIRGIPALEPTQPETPDNAMLLYVLEVPAYTYSVRDIEPIYIDNRRYTMRDIGELEGRIKNLEYYTSLSLLEREANDKQIIDEGGARFKNGILVDSFSGHNVGDVNDPGYMCAIDKDAGILRASFTEDSTRLKLIDDHLTSNSYGDLALLEDEGEVPFIEQMKASTHMSVNPYAVAAWWGDVKLSPSSDEWKVTNQRPDVIVNRENDAATLQRIANATKAQGTVWGSWRTNWTGFKPNSSKKGGFKCRNMRTKGWCKNHGKTWDEQRIRRGIRTKASIEKVRRVVNNRVIDSSFVPFIRSRRVYFKGSMFRPNTKLHIFFDDVDVSLYATKTAFVEHKKNTHVKQYQGQTVNNSMFTGGRQELITDDSGAIEGYFVIPNNAAIKFRTGDREVIFTDSPDNKDEAATTTATAVYSAKGVMEHKQRTILSTRRVRITRERIQENRNLTFWKGNRWGPRTTKVLQSTFFTRWRDPLAQSFMIGEVKTGLFATSIDLYFQKKSKTVPVQAYIVTMDNGYPTQEIVPFSEVTLYPEDVNASQDLSDLTLRDKPTTATNFKFASPVYLQAGVEYAIVVLSNDDNYRLWLSEVGLEDKATGELISKNPYTGVMFKSQNASTWTADQNKDFMFKLNRAKYKTNDVTELEFESLGIDANNQLEFSQLSVISESMSFPETTLDFELSVDSGETYHPISPTEDILLNTDNGVKVQDDTVIKLKAKMSTTSEYVSPLIDLDRVSVNSVFNDVNSEDDVSDTELKAEHGDAAVRYITRDVELNNPADQLDVYLNISRPTDKSNVLVYARFKSGDDSIVNSPFELLKQASAIPISSGADDFNEVLFALSRNQNFSSFQVKIVIVTDEHWNVPTITDFRAIATT